MSDGTNDNGATEDESDSTVSLAREGDGSTLHLRGSVDVRSAADLHRAALALSEGDGDLRVCLTQASRLDASALQILIALADVLSRQGRDLRIVEVPESLAALLPWAGLRAAS
jgi:anti-anti-sigma factor